MAIASRTGLIGRLSCCCSAASAQALHSTIDEEGMANPLRASAEREISAPARRVYHYIADFRQHHHRFLPPAFSDFTVEIGGVGAGTVTRFSANLGGRRRTIRTRVAEPEPGRVLTETEVDTGMTTTFTVTPVGKTCRVQIETRWQPAPGLGGLLERLLAPGLLRSLYAEELYRLDRYAREQAAAEDESGIL